MSLKENNEDSDEKSYNYDIESNMASASIISAEEPPNIDVIVDVEINSNISFRVKCCLKFWLCLLLLIVTLPITICDLVFGYTDTSCIYIYPDNFGVNMKEYLLTAGYINIILISYYIIFICFYIEPYYTCSYGNLLTFFDILQFLLKIFLIIWNIIGACVWWGLFNIDKCSDKIIHYLIVTIIIKLIVSIIFYCKVKNIH